MASENSEKEQPDMSVRPWLSIIIPAFNVEEYLPTCVESINPSSHPDIEVIVVDDGSTDGTSALCDAFASEHANVQAIHRENGGASAARNTGYMHAAGNWIWFVDSDDLVSPYALDALRPLATSTSSEAIQIGFVEFSDDEEPAWPAPMPSENPTCVSASDFIASLYRGRYQHYMWSFLLRADALLSRNEHMPACGRNEHGFPFREDLSLYEDVVSTEEIMRRSGSVESCPWRLYGYRQAAGSMSHRRNNKASDSGIRAVRELRGYDVAPGLAADKTRMEMGLLFTAYRIAERGPEGDSLRRQARDEIEERIRKVGLSRLGHKLFVRYVLLESGLMDKVIDWRDRG